MTLRFALHAAGVLAPGITSLAELFAWRRGGSDPAAAALVLPSPEMLPANERRRASQVVRLTLACAELTLRGSPFAADSLRLVFASDEGTGEVCQQMLESLATTRQVSPLLFHNSVHNAPSGYLTIGQQNRQPATSVSLGAESFAAGLLCAATEAITSGDNVLLLAYDPVMTTPMDELLPVTHACASGWIIRADNRATMPGALATFELDLQPIEPGWSEPALAPPAPWSRNGSAAGLAALALLDDPAPRPSIELRLGMNRLRVTRLELAP
jgi:hypothetical protein